MTYWWESTRDVVAVCREVFPKAVIRVGGIYPTLAPEHAIANLGLRDPLHIQGRDLERGVRPAREDIENRVPLHWLCAKGLGLFAHG
jgi:hypothetical protein